MTERYAQLDVVVGQGGMGQVERYQDTLLERSVARKVMQPRVAAEPGGTERFLREARIQGRLEHPAVVPVYDQGHDEKGSPWFTVQEVRGETLQKVISELARGDSEFELRFPRRRHLLRRESSRSRIYGGARRSRTFNGEMTNLVLYG